MLDVQEHARQGPRRSMERLGIPGCPAGSAFQRLLTLPGPPIIHGSSPNVPEPDLLCHTLDCRSVRSDSEGRARGSPSTDLRSPRGGTINNRRFHWLGPSLATLIQCLPFPFVLFHPAAPALRGCYLGSFLALHRSGFRRGQRPSSSHLPRPPQQTVVVTGPAASSDGPAARGIVGQLCIRSIGADCNIVIITISIYLYPPPSRLKSCFGSYCYDDLSTRL
jgi:hypothetical protein